MLKISMKVFERYGLASGLSNFEGQSEKGQNIKQIIRIIKFQAYI